MRTNKEFVGTLKPPVARYYLADFHVHSPGSADVPIGNRYDALPQPIKAVLPRLSKDPADPAASDSNANAIVPYPLFLEQLVQRRDQIVQDEGLLPTDNWAFVAITDHNVTEYSAGMSQHAWSDRGQHRLIVLPGVELDVEFNLPDLQERSCGIHVLCIFPPCTSADDIRVAIHDASGVNWTPGSYLTVPALNDFIDRLRHHVHYPAMCIAAHVASSKGVQRESKKLLFDNIQAEIARIQGALQSSEVNEANELKARLTQLEKSQEVGNALDLRVLQIIGGCGFDALQVRDRTDECHYRRLHRFRERHGRATPIVASDAHSPLKLFDCEGRIPFIKMSAPSSTLTQRQVFDEIRDHALRFGETRTTCASPGRVTYWIEGIEITPDATTATHFWSDASDPSNRTFVLPLSRNLNCLIGGAARERVLPSKQLPFSAIQISLIGKPA